MPPTEEPAAEATEPAAEQPADAAAVDAAAAEAEQKKAFPYPAEYAYKPEDKKEEKQEVCSLNLFSCQSTRVVFRISRTQRSTRRRSRRRTSSPPRRSRRRRSRLSRKLRLSRQRTTSPRARPQQKVRSCLYKLSCSVPFGCVFH